jgi:hypothetical protein
MSDWFFVGQRVVCIGWDWDGGPFEACPTMPIVGHVYTIRDIEIDEALGEGSDGCAFRFEEIINKPIAFGTYLEPNFHSLFFRPVVIPEADLAQLEAILRGVEQREAVDA